MRNREGEGGHSRPNIVGPNTAVPILQFNRFLLSEFQRQSLEDL